MPMPEGTGDKPGDKPGEKPGEKPDAAQAAITEAVNTAIARERAEADRRIAEATAPLTTRIKELEGAAPKPGDKPAPKPGDDAYAETIRKPLVTENDQLKEQIRERDNRILTRDIKGTIKDLVAEGAEDDVAKELLPRTRLGKGDVVEVVDAEGRLEYGAKGPKTLTEAAAELFAKKPYLAKASVRSGIDVKDVPKGGAPAASKDALKAQIAELEAAGKFGEAAPLKTQLMRFGTTK